MNATQLDYSTVPILSQTSTKKSQCLFIPVKASHFGKEIQQSNLITANSLIIEIMIQKNLKGLERMGVV